jgi:uncharacterized protein (TIGR00661 family)
LDKVKTSSKPVVLIAPLDWGLGHATRCMPLIYEFLKLDFKVILAAEGVIKELYTAEFPGLECIDLKGYRIKYSKQRALFPFKIALQIPSILTTIRQENKWLQRIIRKHNVALVISDNRYGLYSKHAKCIFITHQLAIKTGLGKNIDNLIQKLNYSFIQQVHQCWVPDFKNLPGLAGSLSHPVAEPPTRLQYLGPLSRFQYSNVLGEEYLLFLLSGPEPQRSVFEKLLIRESKNCKQKIILVRGTYAAPEIPNVPDHVKVYDLLTSAQLSTLINQATYVIARSGYSTVMDMLIKNKKCIFIPTPGQTEQVYLANHLMKHQYALCFAQSKFRLSQAIDLAYSFPYKQLNQIENIKIADLIFQLKATI